MSRIALLAVAFATLTSGCAAMSTKRSGGNSAQIQRTTELPSPIDHGSPGARPELGQR